MSDEALAPAGREAEDAAPSPAGPDLGRVGHRVAISTVTLIAANTAVAALGVVSLHVFTNRLHASSYGIFVSVLAFIQTTFLLADLGINTYTGREIARRRGDATQILSENLGLRLVMSALMIPTVIALGYVFPHSESARFEGIALLALAIPCEAVRSVCLSFYVATIQNYKSAVVTLFQQVVFVACAVTAIDLGYGLTGVFVSFDVAMLACASCAYLAVRRSVPFHPTFNPGLWGGIVKQSFGVGAIQIVNVLYLRMNTLILTAMTSYHTVAQYGVSARIVTFLLTVPNFFMLSLLPVLVGAPLGKLTALVNRAAIIMTMVGVLSVSGTTFLARDVVTVLAGKQYQGAIAPLQILSLSVLFTCLTAVFTYSSFARDRHRALLIVSCSGLVCNVVLDVVLIPWIGARGAAISTVIVEFGILLGTYAMFRNRVGSHFTAWFKVGRILAVGALTYLVGRVSLDAVTVPGKAQLLLGVVVFPVVMGVAFVVFRCLPDDLTIRKIASGLRGALRFGGSS